MLLCHQEDYNGQQTGAIMEQKKMKFPKDWYYLQDTEIKKYIKHLLRKDIKSISKLSRAGKAEHTVCDELLKQLLGS